MSKPFDATMKHLLGLFAVDWIEWLAPKIGLPAGVAVDPLDGDLSTVQVAADKVFRLRPPAVGLLHLEPQASWDGELPDRLLLYNTLLHHRHGGPVYSVAILLRPEANAAAMTGTVSRRFGDGTEYLRFGYSTIRVWELKADELLSGGVGALPLALLTNDARGRIGELVERLDRRLREPGVGEITRRTIMTSSYILLGLRYDEGIFHGAFQRVSGMKESSSYQYILNEGRQEGLQEGRQEGRQEGQLQALREALMDILSDRFGQLPVELVAEISLSTDPLALRSAIRSANKVATVAELRVRAE